MLPAELPTISRWVSILSTIIIGALTIPVVLIGGAGTGTVSGLPLLGAFALSAIITTTQELYLYSRTDAPSSHA